MQLRSFNSPAAPQPRGGYSQALLATGASRFLFVSGQVPERRTEACLPISPDSAGSPGRMSGRSLAFRPNIFI